MNIFDNPNQTRAQGFQLHSPLRQVPSPDSPTLKTGNEWCAHTWNSNQNGESIAKLLTHGSSTHELSTGNECCIQTWYTTHLGQGMARGGTLRNSNAERYVELHKTEKSEACSCTSAHTKPSTCSCSSTSDARPSQCTHRAAKVITRHFLLPYSFPPTPHVVESLLGTIQLSLGPSVLTHYAADPRPNSPPALYSHPTYIDDDSPDEDLTSADTTITTSCEPPLDGCCCCAIDLKGNVIVDNGSADKASWESVFELFGFTKMEKQEGKSSQCTLEWWEWTNAFPKEAQDAGCKDDNWCELYRLRDKIPRAKKFFEQFEERCKDCTHEHVCAWRIVDYPSWPKDRAVDRGLFVAVILRSGEDCDCPIRQKSYFFAQYIFGKLKAKPGIAGADGGDDPKKIIGKGQLEQLRKLTKF